MPGKMAVYWQRSAPISGAVAPMPRMSNTFIAPGNDQTENIIADTARSLLVQQIGGGQVNTAIDAFVFEAKEAYLMITEYIS